MKTLLTKNNFPILGALLVSLYFAYKILLGGNEQVFAEIILLPVAILLFLLQLLGLTPIETIYIQVATIIGIPLSGFILFWLYKFVYNRVHAAHDASTKVGNVIGFVLISMFLWSLPNLIVTTHAFREAANIFTGECETFGGKVPIGYKLDSSCSINNLDQNLINEVPLDTSVIIPNQQ